MVRGADTSFDRSQATTSRSTYHQPTRQDTLERSNTTTTIATFFLGRRRSDYPLLPSAANPSAVPAPPPNYQHVDAIPASFLPGAALAARKRAEKEARAALRASKVGGLGKYPSAARIADWMVATDKELGRVEHWRREVAREMMRVEEQKEEEGEEEEEKPLPELPPPTPATAPLPAADRASSPPNPLLLAVAPSSDSHYSHSNSHENSQETVIATVETARVVQTPTAAVRPIKPDEDEETALVYRQAAQPPPLPRKSSQRARDRAASASAAIPPPLPPLPNPIPPSSYRFPPSPTALAGQPQLALLDTAVPARSAFSSATTAQPGPWHGTPPPRTSSLPFGDLVQLPPSAPMAAAPAPPPECSILPPKAAALLGLIPSATAPFSLREAVGPQVDSASLLAAASTPATLDIPPRPPFFHYDSSSSAGAYTPGSRKDSIESGSGASASAFSTRTGASFWSRTAGRLVRHDPSSSLSLSHAVSRPSYDSGSLTTASGQDDGRARHGVGSSFTAQLVKAHQRGNSMRKKGPPSRLRYFRKEGMSSSPDLTTPMSETASAAGPAMNHSQPALVSRAYGGLVGGASGMADDDEVESLVDVVYNQTERLPFPRHHGAHAHGVLCTPSSLGGMETIIDAPQRRGRSSSLGDSAAGAVKSLVRSLSNSSRNGAGRGGFLGRKLSRRPSKKVHNPSSSFSTVGAVITASDFRPSVRKNSTSSQHRRDLSFKCVGSAAVKAAVKFAAGPEPTPIVDRQARRRTRDEWELDSRAISRRLESGLYP
ncbi:hypothetical protein JCM8097_006992 [Rhodosporidiobolus ruineniae]